MTSVRFAWNPMLVDLRREICPRALWQKNGRQWIMSDTEADTFVRAAQARLDFGKSQAQIRVDNVIWVVGFVRGAPYRLTVAASERQRRHSRGAVHLKPFVVSIVPRLNG